MHPWTTPVTSIGAALEPPQWGVRGKESRKWGRSLKKKFTAHVFKHTAFHTKPTTCNHHFSSQLPNYTRHKFSLEEEDNEGGSRPKIGGRAPHTSIEPPLSMNNDAAQSNHHHHYVYWQQLQRRPGWTRHSEVRRGRWTGHGGRGPRTMVQQQQAGARPGRGHSSDDGAAISLDTGSETSVHPPTYARSVSPPQLQCSTGPPHDVYSNKLKFHESSFLVENVTRTSLTCHEEIGRVGRGRYADASDLSATSRACRARGIWRMTRHTENGQHYTAADHRPTIRQVCGKLQDIF